MPSGHSDKELVSALRILMSLLVTQRISVLITAGHKELERAEATKHTQDWGQEGNLNHREAEPEGGLRKNPGGFPILATGARSKTGHDLRSPKSLCPILAWEICSLCTLSKTRATSHARGQKSQTSLLTGALFPIKIPQSPWN